METNLLAEEIKMANEKLLSHLRLKVNQEFRHLLYMVIMASVLFGFFLGVTTVWLGFEAKIIHERITKDGKARTNESGTESTKRKATSGNPKAATGARD
jgi:hypothetical protein